VPFSLKGIPLNEVFVPREVEMHRLEEFFLTPDLARSRRKTFVVHGLGGIGKTQLCVNFARRHQRKYRSMFWLDGSSENSLKQAFLEIARRLP